jgi:hypothetical protein
MAVSAPRRAMVVAHPDDETLWGGGLLAEDPSIQVFVCSKPARDPARVEQFFKACAIYGVQGSVWSQPDSMPYLDPYKYLNGMDGFDEIITHNHAGEYGHSHHRQVHEYIRKHFRGRIITFGHGIAAPTVELSEEHWDKKLRALKCYETILTHAFPQRTAWEWCVKLYFDGDVEKLRYEKRGPILRAD